MWVAQNDDTANYDSWKMTIPEKTALENDVLRKCQYLENDRTKELLFTDKSNLFVIGCTFTVRAIFV